MEKVFLVAVLVVTSLTLFSFRSVENNNNQAEVVDTVNLTISTSSFTEAYRVFPSKFEEYRKTWTKMGFSGMNTSLDEINATLEKF